MSSYFGICLVLIYLEAISCGLESCFKCVDVPKKNGCSKDKDWCLPQHDRCLLMEKKNGNGDMVYDARCSTEGECFTNTAKEVLCDKKANCKVLKCCDGNSCNSARATWIRFDVRLLLLVGVSLMIILLK